ncbi:MAG: murein DD-endopeptidase MepM/ murein hydrolase activator NlpD [Gammaproteobacteria bacterium]|jgi:murein DD-endopeptidase MepM/ murein hydrolase activator NlpD
MKLALFTTEDSTGRRRFTRVGVSASAGSLMIAVAAVSSFATMSLMNDGATSNSQKYDAALLELTRAMSVKLEVEREAVVETRARSQQAMTSLASRVGRLQAELYRLESVAETIAAHGQLAGAVDFSSEVALGGPERVDLDVSESIDADLAALERRINARDRQLSVLESLMIDGEWIARVSPRGWPIAEGWRSSPYGARRDPFTGRRAWHKGMDFAGAEGSDIIAVADGVVSWAGRRSGYGLMVEITHGNGYATRYAHNKTNAVALGDQVSAGQVIGFIGSSGRSTGPHVHFEVWKDGSVTNPSPYLAKNTPLK